MPYSHRDNAAALVPGTTSSVSELVQAVKAAGQKVALLETNNAELRASSRQLTQQVMPWLVHASINVAAQSVVSPQLCACY